MFYFLNKQTFLLLLRCIDTWLLSISCFFFIVFLYACYLFQSDTLVENPTTNAITAVAAAAAAAAAAGVQSAAALLQHVE